MTKTLSKFTKTISMVFTLMCSSCTLFGQKYSINVINGVGGGTYNNGESATITAVVPQYKDFDYWECNGENVSTSNPYTFTVTENASYTANFKNQTATITVLNGTGGGTFDKGTSATISATIPQDKDFDYWERNGRSVSTSNPYTFTVTEDATFTAIFKNQTATISVVNGIGGGTFDKGTSATISAIIPQNKVFDYWESNGVCVSTSNPYTFTVTEDASFTAIFKDQNATITVINGTGGGTYNVGASATITANAAPQDQIFDYWESNGVCVSTSNPYTFTVTEDATFTAKYKVENRGVKRTNATSIDIKPITVSKGGTITIDYKYIDSVTDAENGVSIFLGSDDTNCFGKYKIFYNRLDETYTGVTFTTLNDGYQRLVIVVSELNQVRSDCNAPTMITKVLFRWFEATQGVYFDVKSEPVSGTDTIRGSLYKNAGSPIYLSKTYTVSDGGTIILDYKYFDPVTDAENGVSLFFGTDDTNRFGNYKIFNYQLEKTYNGITFTTLDDGYNRLTVDISSLDDVRSDCVAPTSISQISFRWFEATQGVYFDVNPQDKIEKTTEFQMTDSEFVIANFTDIHVDKESLLSDTGSTGKTIKYGINNSKPDILLFSGDIAGSSSDLNYICTYLDSFKIPYFFVLGNHDHEGSLGYDTISQRISQSQYGYIEKGPEELKSQGNYTVKIKNSDGVLVHGLVMMDTGNKYQVTDDTLVEYVQNPISGVKYGTYKSGTTYCSSGWNGLRGNQIDWYESTVESLDCETTLVCHIPFLEYCKAYEQYQDAVNKQDKNAIAACAPIGQCTMGEQVCGSIENLGMFDRIKKVGSTKNVICGHDHANDFSLLYEGVRLTYALKTGEGAYWKTDGSRCGYTELRINSSGQTSLNQIYYNPLINK